MSIKPGKLLSGEDLLQSHICNDRSLPKVGEKQFKPSGSWLEKKQIQSALEESKQLLEEERVEKLGSLAQAEWYKNKKLAEVTKKVGKFFHTMGFEKDGKIFIYPEEALYLMEMNCLQLKHDGVPLSIQQAYSLLLCSTGCTLKEYRAYSNLTKRGYRLLRYSKTSQRTNYEHRIRLDQHVPQKRVFPVDGGLEVTVRDVSSNSSQPEESSLTECTSVAATGKSEKVNDNLAKSEINTPDVNEPMKDFAKSIADMGKSLVKTENSEGREGLGLDSLRCKILDMLENHFQGQISPEAMNAVSLSASKAILVHVDDVDSEKSCATPDVGESDNKSLCLSNDSNDSSCHSVRSCDSNVGSHQDCFAWAQREPSDDSGLSKMEDDSRNREESARVVRVDIDSDLERVEPSENTEGKVIREKPFERNNSELEEPSNEREETPKRRDSKLEESSKKGDSEQEEPSKSSDSELEEPLERSISEREEASKKSVSEPEVSSKRADSEQEETSERSISEREKISKRSDSELEELPKKGDSEREETSKRSDSELEELPKKGDSEREETSKRSYSELEELPKKSDSEREETSKRSDSELEESSKKGDSELEERSDLESEETSRRSESDLEESSKKGDLIALEKAKESTDVELAEALKKEKVVLEETCGESRNEKESLETDNLETGNVLEIETGKPKPDEEVRDLNVCPTTATQSVMTTEVGDSSSSRQSSRVVSDEIDSPTEGQNVTPFNVNEDVSLEESSSEEDLEDIPSEQTLSGKTISPRIREVEKSALTKDTSLNHGPDPKILECEVEGCTSVEGNMQADDDVIEIDDPNVWKNVKVGRSGDKDNENGRKRTFHDSNGWRSFKELQSDVPDSKKPKQECDDKVDIKPVRSDTDIELIDISEDGCIKRLTIQPKKEIEIVDLDESNSDSSDTSDEPDIKEEKIPLQRPKLVSAFERARDFRRKFIMDCFPNMINQTVCTVDVPLRHLLPPNIDPVKSTYTINRRTLNADRPYQPGHFSRRPFNPPRFNNYYNNHPRPHHPRQQFKPPIYNQPWQGRLPMQVNPAAMQAFQMITSIILPMIGINSVGPTFMGQPQWPQKAPWQRPQRNLQNHQPNWRFQQRPHRWNNNRSHNRPWHNRNCEVHHEILDRPKRPSFPSTPSLQTSGLPTSSLLTSSLPTSGLPTSGLPTSGLPTSGLPTSGLPTPGFSTSGFPTSGPLCPRNEHQSDSGRPKRPFLVEHSATRDLLMDIEDEIRWKKMKRMNEEESDSDSEAEVTITPINTTPKTSDQQPLLRLDQCTNPNQIMASIGVIKTADPRSLRVSGENRQLKISYDLFLPNIPFKKSSPPTPNFRLCVMSVEERVPNPGEISLLLDNIYDGVPLMFAIVDPDNITFYQHSTVDIPKQVF